MSHLRDECPSDDCHARMWVAIWRRGRQPGVWLSATVWPDEFRAAEVAGQSNAAKRSPAPQGDCRPP